MDEIERILVDLLVLLVAPVVFWRAIRGVMPLAVLPILFGLAISIAAARFGFSKAIVGPSEFGETVGWVIDGSVMTPLALLFAFAIFVVAASPSWPRAYASPSARCPS